MREHEIRPFEGTCSDETRVRGYLHVSPNSSGDGLVLTHGAGSNCQTPLLAALATDFCESGMTVLRCDLPFRQLRPNGPPPPGSAEGDQQGLRRAIEAMRQQVSGRVFLGGHSYGGRQASILAASEPRLADALLLLSYPLHPPKRLAELRTAHFPSLRIKALFVHGTRDGFGSIEEMIAALKLIPVSTQLLPIEGAGHELMRARNRADLPKMITEAFTEVIRSAEQKKQRPFTGF
jgi:predicted alpha/beta-hydrolase family hydrolase